MEQAASILQFDQIDRQKRVRDGWRHLLAALPDEPDQMTPEQRKAHVEKMAGKRAEVQKQIADLNAKRDADVKKQMAQNNLDAKGSFDAALREAVREQAKKQGMTFEEK